MSDWYHRQFGDAAVFAVSVSLGRDPHPSGSVAVDAMWGGLEIWARGRCLTRAVTSDSSTTAVRWSLLPLASWLLDVGVILVNEDPYPLAPKRESYVDACAWYDACERASYLDEAAESAWFARRSEWRKAHALRRAGEGAALPNVLFRRAGDRVEISWDNDTWSTGRPELTFTELRGREFVPASEVASVLRDAVRDLTDKAASGAPDVDELRQLRRRAMALEAAETDWVRLVHTCTAEAIASSLPDLATRLTQSTRCHRDGWYVPHTQETELLRHARIDSAAEIRALLDAGTALPQSQMSQELRLLVRPSAAPPAKPWEHGNERAEDVRDRLGWGIERAPQLDVWLAEQGLLVRATSNQLPSSVALVTHRSDDLRAAAHVNPTFDAVRRRETALATALGHILMDESPFSVDGDEEDWAHAARARAFGVALMLPEDGVRDVVAGASRVAREHVDELTRRYGTGREAATRRLKNLGLINETERFELAAAG